MELNELFNDIIETFAPKRLKTFMIKRLFIDPDKKSSKDLVKNLI